MRLLKPKILITGAYGLLGATLVDLLKDDYDVCGLVRLRRPEVEYDGVEYLIGDITRKKEIVEIAKKTLPRIVFNAAAYTHVDRAETEKEACWKTNVDGIANLGYAAGLISARLVHVSTDYVFDGRRGNYREDDRPNPLGYYGKSKLAGENALLASGANAVVARTMVLYGYAKSARHNFVTWLIGELRQARPVRIVDDQFGNPTLADELAQALLVLAKSEQDGVYHVSGKETVDRFSFAQTIAHVFALDDGLISRTKTADLQQPAPRPDNSGFDISKAEQLGIRMSGVQAGLEKFKLKYPM